MNAVSVAADSLDGLRLNFALQAGILRLLSRQEHLNKINVFPVPDGDTGTNLALTVNAVLGSLRKWPDRHAGKTLTRVAERMVKAGWLLRTGDEADRRITRIRLTPAGLKLARKLVQQAREHEAAVLASVSVADAAALKRILRRLIELHAVPAPEDR